MAEHQLPKLTVRVRFPSSAPQDSPWSEAIFLELPGSTSINCGSVGPSMGPTTSLCGSGSCLTIGFRLLLDSFKTRFRFLGVCN
jgi:hypothetical protein